MARSMNVATVGNISTLTTTKSYTRKLRGTINVITYLPKLLLLMTILCRYILRWNIQIKAHLPPTAAPAVDAVLSACQILVGIIDEEIPPPP